MGTKVNKKSLIENVKAVLDKKLTMKDAETAVNVTLQSIVNGLERTGEASITGFGTFKVQDISERQGHNPRTGEAITIAAHRAVRFKPGKNVLEKVNG